MILPKRLPTLLRFWDALEQRRRRVLGRLWRLNADEIDDDRFAIVALDRDRLRADHLDHASSELLSPTGWVDTCRRISGDRGYGRRLRLRLSHGRAGWGCRRRDRGRLGRASRRGRAGHCRC